MIIVELEDINRVDILVFLWYTYDMGNEKIKKTEFKYHSQERAWQRYNRDYTKKNIKEMEKLLKEGNGIFVKEAKGENKDVVYLVYNHIPLKMCYDYKDNKIITILPFDVDEYIKIEEERNKKNGS